MAEPRPRNWKAMRADRVLAMAENRFGRRFASKEAAIAALDALPVREQRGMKKVEVSKAERARRQGASDRMIKGMGANPMASMVDDLAARFTETMAKPTRDGLAALDREIKAAGLTAAESQAFAKAIDHPIAKGSADKILGSISQRLGNLGMFLAKQAAVGGRSAAALAVTLGVGTALALMDAGGSEAAAAEKKKKQGTSKNTVEAKKADAQAKQAEAEAEKAKTETRRLELEAEARRDKRADERREADKSLSEQLRHVATIGVPLAAGMVYGAKKAEAIQAKVETASRAKNRQLGKVAQKVRGSTDPARLAAGVRVADKLKLASQRGPVGGVTAAFLATEAIAARIVAANTENETASEILNGVSVGLGAAAVTTVGTRMVQRATSAVMPDAGALVDVETARGNLKGKAPKAPKAAGPGMLAKASKVLVPVLAGVAAYTAFNDSAAAGESSGESTKKAALAAGDVVSMGGVTAYDEAKARGAGEAEAVASGAAVGAINFATFGIAPMANDALADQGGVAGVISDTVTAAGKKVGELLGWSDAAREASAEVRADAAKADASGGDVVGDVLKGVNGAGGLVMGKIMMSEAKSPSLGRVTKGVLRAGGAAAMATGGVLLADALFGGNANAAEPGAQSAPEKGELSTGQIATMFAGTALVGAGLADATDRIASSGRKMFGKGLIATGISLFVAAAAAGSKPKAFLNEGAERKASETPKAPAPVVVASSAMKKPDGETAGYTRRSKTGQAIQVKAYRTPDRR
ncbi:MAG: hypothetical protein AB7S70_00530 [Hyphomicrobium sp.]|uniref:hypothetical protein n=1 Tax=Hyphomicrobium sp. TaxID=82 RepID=UPI003D09B286